MYIHFGGGEVQESLKYGRKVFVNNGAIYYRRMKKVLTTEWDIWDVWNGR